MHAVQAPLCCCYTSVLFMQATTCVLPTSYPGWAGQCLRDGRLVQAEKGHEYLLQELTISNRIHCWRARWCFPLFQVCFMLMGIRESFLTTHSASPFLVVTNIHPDRGNLGVFFMAATSLLMLDTFGTHCLGLFSPLKSNIMFLTSWYSQSGVKEQGCRRWLWLLLLISTFMPWPCKADSNTLTC